MSAAAVFALVMTTAFHAPPQIHWGASVGDEQRQLAGACTSIRVRRVDPPFLDSVKRRQMQIDCEGLRFEGARRHAEFVFADGRLVMVWIMHRADEDAAMSSRMAAAMGPGSERKAYLVFAHRRAALRIDKHEVLFWGPSLDAEIAGWFGET